MSIVTATILSNGKKLDPKYQILGLDVCKEINRIPHARIILIDGTPAEQKFELTDSDFFLPGSKVEIKLRYENEPGGEKTVFKGVVLRQSISAGQDGFLLTVELRHQAFKLTTSRGNFVFKNKQGKLPITDTDAVNSILKTAGLTSSGSVGTGYVHKQLVQYGCTGWDFILSRADVNGCAIIVEDDKLVFSAIKDMVGKGEKGKIAFGIDLVYEFEWEADAAGQMAKVDNKGWDVKKGALVANKEAKGFKSGFGNFQEDKIAKDLVTDPVLISGSEISKDEAQAWAEARLVKSRMSLFRGKVSMKGRADFNPGDTVTLEGMGNRFKGKALVSAICHRVDRQGWVSDIQFGLPAEWFSESSNVVEKPASGLLPGIHGLQIGIVDEFETEDDNNKNFRVKVKVPALGAAEVGVIWARLTSLYAGEKRGFFFYPEPGDEVIIGFLNDDPRQAIVLGSLYSSLHPIAPDFKLSKENADKGIVTKNGTRISIKDVDSKSVIELMTPGKNSITINDEKKSIVIMDQNKNMIEMTDGGIVIKSGKDIELNASGNVTIKGSKVDVK